MDEMASIYKSNPQRQEDASKYECDCVCCLCVHAYMHVWPIYVCVCMCVHVCMHVCPCENLQLIFITGEILFFYYTHTVIDSYG